MKLCIAMLLCLSLLAFAQAQQESKDNVQAPVVAKDNAQAPELNKENADDPVVVIKTSKGDIYIELFAQEAPITVESFTQLAEGTREFTDSKSQQKMKRPFYDGLIFHRVIKDFMIQGGCPRGDGTGGPGYDFADEINANQLGLDKLKAFDEKNGPHPYLLIRSQADFNNVMLRPLIYKLGIKNVEEYKKRVGEIKQMLDNLTVKECYENLGYQYNDKLKSHLPVRGMIAMANSGPNTNGSQFFINLQDTPWLQGKHTVFGKVIKGMEVVDAIGAVAVDAESSKPQEDVKIISVRLWQADKK